MLIDKRNVHQLLSLQKNRKGMQVKHTNECLFSGADLGGAHLMSYEPPFFLATQAS